MPAMIIPSLNWTSILWTAVPIYMYWVGVTIVYFISKIVVRVFRKSSRAPATAGEKVLFYFCGVVVCLVLALMLGYRLGTHTEGDDGYMDAGETVVDYEPTDKQRWTHGAKVFVVMVPAVLMGPYAGFRQDKKLTVQEREKIENEINSAPQNEGWVDTLPPLLSYNCKGSERGNYVSVNLLSRYFQNARCLSCEVGFHSFPAAPKTH
jgi:hypothetical protein